MLGGHRHRRRTITSILAMGGVLLALLPPVNAAAGTGNASINLSKTISATALNPVLGLTLTVDKTSAIPADTLTYSAQASNTGATLGVSGAFKALNNGNIAAAVAAYYDEVEYQAPSGSAWTPLAGFQASQSGYTMVSPSPITSGMVLKATGMPSSGITYPSSGDPIVGTQLNTSSTATWSYQASIALTLAQIATLRDPSKVSAIRNVVHFEVTPRAVSQGQPFTYRQSFTNPLQAQANAAAATNVTVTFTLPNGSKVTVDSSKFAGLASIAPGGSVTATTTYSVQVPAAKGTSESDSAYVSRLRGIDGSNLSASAAAAGTGYSGPLAASAPGVSTTEHLPILAISKSGPASAKPGSTASYPLSLNNSGSAVASGLAIVDSLPGGSAGTVSGTPGSLAAGGSGSATASYAIPGNQPPGNLADTASLTWQDANANGYGPVSSTYTTSIVDLLLGGALTLAPASAGPDAIGTSQSLTATLVDHGGSPVAGQSVSFTITGANPGSGSGTTDATGTATFTYAGALKGTDQVQATATNGVTSLQSNTTQVSWVPAIPSGSQLSLSPVSSGPDVVGTTQTLTATLLDRFGNPVAGVAVSFAVTGANPGSGSGTTDAAGTASFTYSGASSGVDSVQATAANGITSVVSNTAQVTWAATLQGGKLTLTPSTAGPNVTGTSQIMVATLVDAAGNPIMGQTVSLTVTGANPTSASKATDAAGDAVFTYVGANKGTDQVQATATSGSITLQSNTASVSWVTPVQNVSTTTVTGRFYHSGGCGCFDATNLSNPVFTTNFPTINLNPPAGTIPYNNSGVGVFTRPMYNVTTDVAGNFTGAIAVQGTDVQGTLHQAGVGDMFVFNAVFTGTYVVAAAGDVTFNFFSDDGFVLGIANGASRVGGSNTNPPALTPLQQYPVMGAYNVPTSPISNNITVHFPAAGTYPYEVDYNECCGGQLALTMATGGKGVAPTGNLALTPISPASRTVGQTQSLTVAVMDASGVALANQPVTLSVSGVNQQQQQRSSDSSGLATFTYQGATAGTDQIQASAMVSGVPEISNIVTLTWSPAPPAPTISSPSPADGSLVSKPIPISATFAPPPGQTITSWQVTYQAQDPGPVVTLASGTGTPPATLATFDPTVLANDTYSINISATASGGGTQTSSSTVVVYGNLKLGRYTTTYQDLSVPVSGFQMEVRRTYDSIDKTQGDFGIGWKVSVANFRSAPNRVLGAGGWTEYNSYCVFGLCLTAFRNSAPRFVTVTFPDQHTETFDFTPGGGTNIFFGGSAAFTARPGTGTTSTLQVAGDTSVNYNGDGNLYDGGWNLFNPQRFTLTTHDGRVLVLDRTAGLVSETDRDGNKLSIDANGVHASNGESITYTRDPSNRITQISGPSNQSLSYSYSAAGDLASSIDPDGNTTTYAYDANHDLLKTTGPGGTQPLTTLNYDSSGRLVSVTDGSGNTTQVSNNVAGQQQTVTDATGRLTTIYTLDDLGDVVRQDEITGGQTLTTTATYDATGRPLTRTDPAGHVWSGVYDAAGELTSLSLPSAHATSVAYDASGNVTGFTDALGHTRSYKYDGFGNLVSSINALGATESFGYDSSGHVISRTDALSRTTTYSYDGAGNLVRLTDARGNTATFTNDASGRVLTQTDAFGKTTAYSYDANGNLTSVTDPLGNVTRYTYNGFNQLASSTDPAAKVTSYGYDAANRVVSQTDPLGRATNYAYDADSRIVSITDPTGAVTSYAYDGFGRLASQTDPLGRITNYSYDGADRLASTTRPNGGLVTNTYDVDGHLVSETDALGRKTTYGYDAAGHQTSVTDPLGLTTTTSYDAEGQPTFVADPIGDVTARSYDAAGELVSLADPLGRTTKYGYDAAGNQVSVTDPLGHATTAAYDADNRLTSSTDALSRRASYGYDGAGRITSITVASGASATMTYDNRGMVIAATDPLNRVIRYGYDDAGQLTSMTDPLGHVTTYAYDAAGRQTKTVDALGGTATVAFDADGEQTSVVNPRGDSTRQAYDTLGNVASQTNPAGGVTTNTYDMVGELTKSIDSRGVTVTYAYDLDGRRVSEGIPGGTITTSYDNASRQTSVVDPTGTTIYSYDAGSQVTSVAAPQGALTYTYDGAGNRATMTMPSGKTVTYGYDAANQLTQLKDWLGKTTTLTYDANGSLASVTRPNGVVSTYAYDAAEQLVALNHDGPSGAITHDVYTYDADGNRASFASAAGKEQYTFDALNRLTQATYPNGDIEAFTYDAAGNQTSKTFDGATTNFSYNAAGQLTSAGSTSYAYDAAGNVANAGTSSYTWDYANRLTSATVGSNTSSYTYNANGVRSSAATGTTTSYLTDTQAGLPQVVDDGTTSYVDVGANPIEQVGRDGSVTYPLGDALGSIRQIADASGAVAGSAAYDVFGGVRSQSGTGSIFGFTGQQTDATGLLFLRARYLDPTVGRFLSADTLQPNAVGTQGFNPYSYVAGRPTTLSDPTGHAALAEYALRLAIAGVVGGAVGAGLGALFCPHDANYGNCVIRGGLLGLLAGLIFALFPPGFALFGSELAGACVAGAVSGGVATGVGQLAEQSPDLGNLAVSAGVGCVTAGVGSKFFPWLKGRIQGEPGNVEPEPGGAEPPRPVSPTPAAPEAPSGGVEAAAGDRSLGMDPARGGTFIQSEYETALRIEAERGVKLTRSMDASVDWVDQNGKTYDAVGPFPAQYFDQEWPNLQGQIVRHLGKADYIPVDVSQFTSAQVAEVQQFIAPLDPRVFIVGK